MRGLILRTCLMGLPIALIASRPYKLPQIKADSLRDEIPITISYVDNRVTPIIDVSINNKTFKAVFDTGSSGLRILGGAVKSQAIDTIDQRVSYTYGDGAKAINLRGEVVTATMTFGNSKTNAPIRLMSIDSARYGPLANWQATGDSALIQSTHFRGLPAIIGVGLRSRPVGKDVVSPLAQLAGNGKFIVRFPSFGGSKGKLIINPEPKETEGFTLFHLTSGKTTLPGGYSSWADNELNGCLYVNGKSACQPTMIDSGDADIQVFSDQFTHDESITKDNNIVLEIKDKDAPAISIKNSFYIGDKRQHGKDYVYLHTSKTTGKNIFGTHIFFEYDVLYDLQNGVIGLKKK